MGPVKATLDSTRDAITLARLFNRGDVESAVDMVMGMSEEELRCCLLAQSGFHATAVLRASQLLGCSPAAIFDTAAVGMEEEIRERGEG